LLGSLSLSLSLYLRLSSIHKFVRLFIVECFSRGYADRMQIFSTYFIDEDFVDACVGFTHARIEGKA